MNISIIVPARNEEQSIENYLKDCQKLFKKGEYSGEVIVVDDASTDNTLKKLKELSKVYKFLVVLHNEKQGGITGCWLKGVKNAKYDVIHFSVADLESLPSEDVPKLIPPLVEGYDMSVAQKKKDGRNAVKVVLSSMFSATLKIFFGVNGPGWVKAVRKDIFEKIPPLKHNWHRFIVPLAADAGLKIKEVKTNFYPRNKGVSNFGSFGFSRGFDALGDLIEIKAAGRKFRKRN